MLVTPGRRRSNKATVDEHAEQGIPPAAGYPSPRAFSGKPCVDEKSHHCDEKDAQHRSREWGAFGRKQVHAARLTSHVTGCGFLTESHARSDRLAICQKHHIRHRKSHSHGEERSAKILSPSLKWRGWCEKLLALDPCRVGWKRGALHRRRACRICRLPGSHPRCCSHVTRPSTVKSMDTDSNECAEPQ